MREVSSLARVELLDRLYYEATGWLAPGKSYPAAAYRDSMCDENRERYQRWCAEEAWRCVLNHAVLLEEENEELRNEL